MASTWSSASRVSVTRPSSMVKTPCAVCGTIVMKYACHLKRIKTPTCSRRCNGALRGEDWKAHGHKGRAAWTAAAVSSFRAKMSGPNNPAWKGGVLLIRGKGNYMGAKYVRCPAEYRTMARPDGYIAEHRLVAAQAMGRILARSEVVHHVNHNSLDNRLENLMVFASNADHKRFEARGTPQPIWQP